MNKNQPNEWGLFWDKGTNLEIYPPILAQLNFTVEELQETYDSPSYHQTKYQAKGSGYRYDSYLKFSGELPQELIKKEK